MKLLTEVEIGRGFIPFGYGDKILVVGSCFADEAGTRMANAGLDVCVNPFGTLYNPVSVCNSLQRLASGVPFSADECVEMGAGASLVCSFSHHTSFARPTAEEFLKVANESFASASAFFKDCGLVIITLGTSWCYKFTRTGEIVSNCLKIDGKEFERERLTSDGTFSLLSRLVGRFSKGTESIAPKKFIFTVSPIRHLKDGAHGNQVSKASLLLAVDKVCEAFPEVAEYFPAYEIMMDELRDYRFYAEDMVHPTSQAADYIWERFQDFALRDGDRERLLENEKAFRRSLHRPIHQAKP